MGVIVTDDGTIEIIEVGANTTTVIEQLSTGPQGPPGTNSVNDDPYNATTWDSNTDAATKNAIRDKIETLEAGYEELTFAYGDATPQLIFTAGAGDIISSVELSIITPFNGTNAALSIGDVGVTDRLMSTAENMPDTEGTYITTPLHEYSASTAISVYITPGAGASAGNGFIKIYTK